MNAAILVEDPVAEALAGNQAGLLRYVGRLLGNAGDAEDVVQDTFLRALTAARTPPLEELRPWLYRVATNRAIDFIRLRRRNGTMPAEPPHPHGTAALAEDRVLLAEVRAFIAGLPPKQKAALILRRYEGREYAEIGQILGCSEESARANAYQAVRRIRARFIDAEEPAPNNGQEHPR